MEIDNRYTNEMIDDIMLHLVPSFCYRNKEVTPQTQRLGFMKLGSDEFKCFYMHDRGLLFMLEDSDFDLDYCREHLADIMATFSEAIKYAMNQYGLQVYEVKVYDNTPSFSLELPNVSEDDKKIGQIDGLMVRVRGNWDGNKTYVRNSEFLDLVLDTNDKQYYYLREATTYSGGLRPLYNGSVWKRYVREDMKDEGKLFGEKLFNNKED